MRKEKYIGVATEPEEVLKPTKTLEFLFPLLDMPRKLLFSQYKKYGIRETDADLLVNAYLYDDNIDYFHTDHITLLLRNYQDLNSIAVRERLIQRKDYVEDYEINSSYIAMVFKIDSIEYDLFLMGKYSCFSDKHKGLINKICGENSTSGMAVRKSPALKRAVENKLGVTLLPTDEVWGSPELEKEILTQTIRDLLKESLL